MKALLVMLALMIMILRFVHGQDSILAHKYHSVTYDNGSNRMKEENLVPLVHTGTIHGLTYRFEKPGKRYHEVFVGMRYGKLKSSLETEKVSQNARIGTGYCMGFGLLHKRIADIYLGFNVSYLMSFLEFPVWDESRAYWGTSLTLGISCRTYLNTKKNQFWVTGIDINPMGLYSRPDELRQYAQEKYTLSNILLTMNSHISAGFADKVFLSSIRTEYRFHTRRDHYLAILYVWSYSRIKKANEHPLYNSTNSIGISLGL